MVNILLQTRVEAIWYINAHLYLCADTVYVVYLAVILIWRFGDFIGSPNLNHAVLTRTHEMN